MIDFVTLAVTACLLSGCSASGNDPLPPAGGGGNACDTTPVALDLRSPALAQPLLAVPGQWPQNELYAIPYTYLLHVPEHLPNRPVPLLVALHGLAGSGPQFAHQSDWQRFADEYGFIVAFPTGLRKWDTTPNSFDVRFIRNVVAQIRSEHCVDPKRIWATGHSYGGYMTQRLACDAGDLFAAGAEVEGGDITQLIIGGPCDAGQSGDPAGHEPVPLAFWHGTADRLISYQWSRDSLVKWVQRYQCTKLDEEPGAAYGPVELYGDCKRADIVDREALSGEPFLLRYHSYVDHAHGYPDGCGGQGQLGATACSPDPGTWPTPESHNREILDFLYRQSRARPAAKAVSR